MTGLIIGMVGAGICIIERYDRPLPARGRKFPYILGAAFLEGRMIAWLTKEEPEVIRLLLSVLGASLLLASVTDILIRQVYNFVWWPPLASAVILAVYCGLERFGGTKTATGGEAGPIWSLLIFCFLQMLLFRHMYGKADSYAFCVCAAGEAARGMELTVYLVHMFLSYALLIPVQTFRRNIDTNGRLKQPVPFLPYITAAFWLTMIWEKLY